MGLFSLSFVGSGFILVGAWESLISASSSSSRCPSPPSSSLSSPLDNIVSQHLSRISPPNSSQHHHNLHHPRHSTVTLVATASLSLFFFFNALFALVDAYRSHDSIGSALQLQVLAVSSLFLLFSLLGLVNNLSFSSLSFPYPLTNLVVLFAFVEEFLVFYLQSKDPNGVENRYFDLMLIPISICVFSTVIDLKSPDSGKPRLARGIGLILQGTWFVQMGLSFYTDWLAQNCNLQRKSWGNYTIKCKGHMDDHRGKAIAVLLFNCHLAFLVVVIAGVYSVVGRWGGYTSYRPLGTEMQMDNQPQFTLDSDDEDGNGSGIGERKGHLNGRARESGGALQLSVDGH